MWTYVQKTGELLHNGLHIGKGYSGFNDPVSGKQGKNNPDLQDVPEIGPIPVGLYKIGAPVDTQTHGPYVLPLTPDPANEMFHRSHFLIHGDSVVEPGTASRGCIILGRDVRTEIWTSGDRALRVISGVAEEAKTA